MPKVGMGIYIVKDGKVLLGKRKGSIGDGEYASPGGHLEYMESFEHCAIREVKEETGLEIANVRFLRLWNQKHPDYHYINIAVTADWVSGEPKVMEPDSCESWDWYDFDHLPNPLYPTIHSAIEALKTGKNFFDA
ncbi:MAG: NUDIX domain-containing protein [Candidatus Doudnabacteria bacterium]|nr:NUDIX domain-containing protein [Candidatus Doudnabacteria bacterium]